jgi:tetraacyldisaccharide 4'-kinase
LGVTPKPSAALDSLLWPLAQLFNGVSRARSLAYDHGWLKSYSTEIPVVSVGNITAGGTGKTPITSFLINEFKRRGLRVGVVSRGYGGTERGPVVVSSDGGAQTAYRFGDEPAWLASRHSDVKVVVGADRLMAVGELVRACSGSARPNLVLADDAFQHRRLARNFDIVVIDATEPLWHYRPLPLGRLREGFAALERAHCVFVTKTNLADSNNLQWIDAKIKDLNARAELLGRAKLKVVYFDSVIDGLAPIDAEPSALSTLKAEAVPGESVLLASGIGRPEAFARSVTADLGVLVKEHLVFPDHHSYTDEDWRKILSTAQELRVKRVIITEKDAVKLSGFASGGTSVPVWVSRLEVRPRESLEELHGEISRLVL